MLRKLSVFGLETAAPGEVDMASEDDESFDTGKVRCTLRPLSAILLLVLACFDLKVLHASAARDTRLIWVVFNYE